MNSDVTAVLDGCGRGRTALIDILWRIQRHFGHVSEESAAIVADRVGTSRNDVLETATFYHFFHTAPAGRHPIYLSNNVIAKLHGFHVVRAALEREAGVQFGGPASAEFGLFEVACIGMSDHEPAMLIDGVVFADLTPTRVADIVAGLKAGKSAAELADPTGSPRSSAAYVQSLSASTIHTDGPVFFGEEPDYADVLNRCRTMSSEDALAVIAASGLRGRGGAGFPTADKWRFCRVADGSDKYVICNADEGEPGTFKDRVLLTRSPEAVFAGMAIAAHAVGARHGIVYLRAEYEYLTAYLTRKIDELRTRGVLGDRFDIRIQLGAGAYICGDESALIESCEGNRGTPRLKPPFPVQHGFLGMPTVVNNVETFAAASQIMDRGAEWFAAFGVPGSRGTRLLSVSGDCAAPGIYEVEWGTTLADVLQTVRADRPHAVQISGPSGEMLSVADESDRRLAYHDLSCNGSFMVFNRDRDLLEVVGDFMQFFVDESCGICVPCRAGNVLLRQKISRIAAGRGRCSDLGDLATWGRLVSQTSRCGLGAASPNSILNTLDKFPQIYTSRMVKPAGAVLPSFDPAAELGDHALAVVELAPGEELS